MEQIENTNKTVDCSPLISLIIVHVSGLNIPNTNQELAEWNKKLPVYKKLISIIMT